MLASPFRRALGVALLGMLGGSSAAAQGAVAEAAVAETPAAPSPLALTWLSSDPSCEGASVATRALESVPAGIIPRPTEAHARVARDGTHWLVELETRSGSNLGRRTLRGESCEEIQHAIALLLAMILESEAKAEAASPATIAAPAIAVVPTLAPALPPQSPEIDVPAQPSATRLAAGFGGLLRSEGTAAMGLQPSLGLGAGGSIGATYGPFELHVGAAYWPASRVTIFDRNGSLEMSRTVLNVTACYQLWDLGRLRAVPCVSPELAWIKWHSVGLRLPEAGEKNHVGSLTALLDLRLELLGPLFLAIAPGLTWERPQPFRARRCQNCSSTEVFQTWGIAPRLGAGVGARF